MLIFETQILKLGLYGEETEPVGEGSIDIKGLARNLILLVGSHGPESAHVVKAVGHLYEHYPDILAHSKKELAEIFGLCRSLVTENTSRNLCQTLNYARNLATEMLLDILDSIFRVLDHIMKKGRAYRGGAEANFLRCNLGHGYRMENIRLARATAHPLVGFLGEAVGAFDYFDLLPMVA